MIKKKRTTKCDCGNVARFGWHRCVACEDADNHHETQIEALHNCTSVDDLKGFIADYLMNS